MTKHDDDKISTPSATVQPRERERTDADRYYLHAHETEHAGHAPLGTRPPSGTVLRRPGKPSVTVGAMSTPGTKGADRAVGDLLGIVESLVEATGVESPADLLDWVRDAQAPPSWSADDDGVGPLG